MRVNAGQHSPIAERWAAERQQLYEGREVQAVWERLGLADAGGFYWDGHVVLSAQCATCARRRQWPTCEAFPGGVPREILAGLFDHRQPFPSDGGLRYEERKRR